MSLSLSAILTIVDEATRPLKMIQQMSDSSSNSIEDLTRSIDRLNQTFGGSNARKYNQSLQQASQSTSKLQAVTRLLAAEYGHVDRGLTSLLNKTDQWNAQLKQNRQNIFKDVCSTAMQLTAVGFAASVPIKAFADAEEASTKLKVSMMDSTGKVAPEFEKINQLATKLGAQLPGSNADFQNMMTNLFPLNPF
ncbi:phage tail tape measure protein [Acinetobacter sp. WCHAc010034]|uniref:phage tail tape measure protein n=1 Tax=Acinetobacter sp. WCHAc010034 TaxID=1879049 RepID=UPI00083B15C7|nr:phage tail tape measure protein [Acinetobacter sp. WCHAc010034]AYA03991.1 phage tail tape measure protein [Acinetobacter sp. WCHAc010034]